MKENKQVLTLLLVGACAITATICVFTLGVLLFR